MTVEKHHPNLELAIEALRAMKIIVRAMKRADCAPADASIAMMMLVAGIAHEHGLTLEQLQHTIAEAWSLAQRTWPTDAPSPSWKTGGSPS